MKATYNPSHKTKFTTSHRRENATYEQLTVIDLDGEVWYDNRPKREIIARTYYGSASNTCCVWISITPDAITSGTGKATGYGYHRPSEALQTALNNAGITLDTAIDGRGDERMAEALLAVAELAGFTRPCIIKSHP